uniref:cytokine receptor common subunit beta n=1 Tax=Ictidomys tridecemlineatus TaxID=43179 RepID=UPI001A9DF5A7|nr:cytokine receptor common subunit beta [Ictidomys tridecemlineatus]
MAHCTPRSCRGRPQGQGSAHGHRAAGPLWAGTRPWWPPWPSRALCSLPAVQPPPPKDPQISKTGGHFLLTWSVALGGPQTPWLSQGDLEFEVVYRRLSDSWEEASSLYSRSSPAVLGAELAQPRNLQCVFDGAHTLGCSWEVRSPVTSSVSFGLFYASSPEAQEEECAPVLKEALSGLYTRLRCQIPVPDPGARGLYVVSVRPRSEGRFIKSSDNIQMARPTLSVTRDGSSFSLCWGAEHSDKIQPVFEMARPTLSVTRDGSSFSLCWGAEHSDKIQPVFEVQYRRDAEDWGSSSVPEPATLAETQNQPAAGPAMRFLCRPLLVSVASTTSRPAAMDRHGKTEHGRCSQSLLTNCPSDLD